MRGACRPRDQVARLGGDELLVILPGAGPDDGPRVLVRIADAVSGLPIALSGPGGTTLATPRVSLGWAWGGAGSSFGGLVETADAAMYAEKGRRRGTGEWAHAAPSTAAGSAPTPRCADSARR